MNPKTLALRKFVAGAVLCSAPLAVQAAAVLDQSTLGYTFGSVAMQTGPQQGFGRAETFTVGISGTLDSAVVIENSVGPPLELDVLGTTTTTSGVPSGGASGSTVLAKSTSITPGSGNQYTFDLSSSHLQVTQGETLALEVIGAPGGGWAYSTQVYPGGSDYFYNVGFSVLNWTANPGQTDLFATYVVPSVPLPASGWLMLSGLAGIGAIARRRLHA